MPRTVTERQPRAQSACLRSGGISRVSHWLSPGPFTSTNRYTNGLCEHWFLETSAGVNVRSRLHECLNSCARTGWSGLACYSITRPT